MLLITAMASNSLQAQEKEPYIPLLDTNKVWYHIEAVEFGGWNDEQLEVDYDNILNVNHTIYHFLYSYYYIREDTITKKVYTRSNENSPEKLLYDISLQEGDSVCYFGYGTHWFYIDSLRTINLYDIERKIWHLKSKNQYKGEYVYPTWIEGIGSLCSPIILDFGQKV